MRLILGARVRVVCTLLAGQALTSASAASPDGGASIVQLDFAPMHAPPLLGAELVSLTRRSSTRYITSLAKTGCPEVPLQDFASATWPALGTEIEATWIVRPNGATEVVPYHHAPEVLALLKKGASFLDQKDYAEATACYRKALQISPHDYMALLFLGECASKTGFVEDALELYHRARLANTADPLSYSFEATAFLALGQPDRALDAYAEALTRAPRNSVLLGAIQSRSGNLGIVLRRDLFHPLALARRKNPNEVQVCMAATTPHWLAYGLCKAVWLVEEGHRQLMTGKSEHRFTSAEETECLANLLSMYEEGRKAQEIQSEQELERLLAIVKAGFGKEFILYDLASRILPQAPLFVPAEERGRLKLFVQKFVLEKRAPESDSGAH